MLKYVKHHLTSISGIDIYPLISFLMFFVFFIALTIWVLRADKTYIQKLKNIPFDEKK
ncbi:MAG: CcoQ/FixQ family Cbb3-type cytochrome c oxidase assembly chaperone [Cytophagaceae bacterium]|nr:CcoQ/FixQ family Cbb3-type cytochrome c oxidase assembly chaperone [Cytophagaceae bacterium]MDW8456137.1 CcoQ/FixQ family Cbb3-type cytochrome c oxidase assembly chaperone [Cytophagaceae bacterium]